MNDVSLSGRGNNESSKIFDRMEGICSLKISFEGVTFGAAKHGIVKNVLQILWPLSGSEGLRLKPPDNLALLASRWGNL